MRSRYSVAGGGLLLVGALGYFFSLQISQFIDGARYNVAENFVSDLGTMCRTAPVLGRVCVELPSHNLFDYSSVALGICLFACSALFYSAFRSKVFTPLVALSGVGVFGVGVFTEAAPAEHTVFSLIAFLFGGLAAIASYRIMRGYFGCFSVAMGAATILFLLLDSELLGLGLGVGGAERMVVYPELIWAMCFGGALLSQRHLPNTQQGEPPGSTDPKP